MFADAVSPGISKLNRKDTALAFSNFSDVSPVLAKPDALSQGCVLKLSTFECVLKSLCFHPRFVAILFIPALFSMPNDSGHISTDEKLLLYMKSCVVSVVSSRRRQ